MNVAATLLSAVTLTAQVPLPLQAPLQPRNVQSVCGVTLNVTLVPLANEPLHVPGQFMPAGELVTWPLSDGERLTVNVYFCLTVCAKSDDVLPSQLTSPA